MGVVLITRPEPAAQETALRVAALGHRAIVAPLLAIEELPARRCPPTAACVITSANAVHAIPPHTPVFAVGDATAARARARTDAPVHSAAGDAVALARLVRGGCDRVAGPLLLLSGARQGQALAADLRAHGFRVIRRAVYRAVPLREFPPGARAAIEAGEIDAIMFFSPETAQAFVRLLPQSLRARCANIRALSLSPAIARVLGSWRWQDIASAAHPSQQDLLKLL